MRDGMGIVWMSARLSLWDLKVIVAFLVLLVTGCGGRQVVTTTPEPTGEGEGVTRMGHAIQVGAFSELKNAVYLNEALEGQGLNPYYFLHESGLYKVRFGDFPTEQKARSTAERLCKDGVIKEFYIVGPRDYAALNRRNYAGTSLREVIVESAERFIGLPYQWGGASPERGFDCSGLAMAVYRLNGLNLPRTCRQQYRAGRAVSQGELLEGDLVFFATSGNGRVSHVGVYTGRGEFIHAPGRNDRIRKDSLSRAYYRERYVGARTYLQSVGL